MSLRRSLVTFSLAALAAAGAGRAAHAETSGSKAAPQSGSGAVPEVAPPLTLARAIELLKHENLRLVAARHDVSAARADVIAAGLIPNPTLSASAQLLTHGAVTGGEQELSVMLTQPIPVSGHVGLRKDAASAAATAAEWDYAAAGWQLVGELKRAYLSLRLAQARSRVLGGGLTDLEQIQHVLDERARAGANPAYDRLRLEVERGSLTARLSQAELALVGARAALARTIGGDTSARGLGAEEPLPEPSSPPADEDALVRRAWSRRPEIEASHRAADAAGLRARAARRRYFPDPELGIGYGRWLDVPGAAPSSGGAALVALALPLPIFDHGQGTIERHDEQTRAAGTRARDTRLVVRREVEEAVAKARSSVESYRSYREHVGKDVESVRRIAELAYREGRGTILELLDAYSSYLRVQEQTVELHGLALSAELELEQAVGP